ncbi:MAG: hypothetical protein M1812_001137 [Candelaria pacifica]|nr:MAG: hypothetical protein M1812_001137 [Candelaria pacifica]
MSQPEIPARGASLRDLALRWPAPEDDISSLHSSIGELRRREQLARKSMASLDSSTHPAWWDALSERVHCQLERIEIQYIEDQRAGREGHKTNEEMADIREQYGHDVRNLNHQLTRILDRNVSLSLKPKYNKPFVDLLETLVWPKLNKCLNSSFKELLIEKYGAANPKSVEKCWSPVSKGFSSTTNRKAAHIFPHKLGQEIMDLVFGELPSEDYELAGAKNGLLLPFQIAEQFEMFNLVIIPHKEGNGRWILRVLDHNLLKHEVGHTHDTKRFSDIDGDELVFTNNFRPGARFLYFHYVLALIEATRRPDQKCYLKEVKADMPVWAKKAGLDVARFANLSAHSIGQDANQSNESVSTLNEILEDEDLYDIA